MSQAARDYLRRRRRRWDAVKMRVFEWVCVCVLAIRVLLLHRVQVQPTSPNGVVKVMGHLSKIQRSQTLAKWCAQDFIVFPYAS